MRVHASDASDRRESPERGCASAATSAKHGATGQAPLVNAAETATREFSEDTSSATWFGRFARTVPLFLVEGR